MATLATRLETLTLRALEQIVGPDCELSAQIAPTRDEKHGDYQCNAALGLVSTPEEEAFLSAGAYAAEVRRLRA